MGTPGRFRPGFPCNKEGGIWNTSSMMKVCEDSRFFFGQADLLLAYLDTLHQKGHVAAKGAHGLQALGIFLDLLGRAAVDHVPILAAGHWHPTHGIIKTDEPRTLDFSGVRGFLVTNVCIVQRSAA